jgi:hypothetical protein
MFPWVDGMMAEILLKTPEEKLDEIWNQVKHEKFKKENINQFIIDNAIGSYEKEEDIPPPPTTLSPEEIEACKTKSGPLPKLVLEERIVEVSG